ncbi:MAG: D-alanyl-D-alanine carboxypeptidase family protein, partial [Patescibacteria group bacterium]
MLQYFFIRTKRRLKAKLARNNWKLSFGRGKFLRWGGFFSLLLLILQISPSVAGSYKKQEGGDVAGTAKSPSAEEVELEEQIEERITYPHRIAESRSFPDLTARAVVIVDEGTDKVLYEQNADIRFPPASLTKMMTALVALDIYEFYEVITVPEQCSQDMVGTAQMGLVENERITVETLLYGLLVNSAADAACVLVNGVGEERLFISLMNQKAAELGLA